MSSKKSSPWGRNGSGAVVVTRISGRSSGSKTWYFGTNSSREMLRSSRSANLYSLNCHDAVMSRACTISKSILNLPSAFGEKVTAYYKEIYIYIYTRFFPRLQIDLEPTGGEFGTGPNELLTSTAQEML